MSKIFSNIFKKEGGKPAGLDNRESLVNNICSTLTGIMEEPSTAKGRQLIVWLDCEKQIEFDQYDSDHYRDLMLSTLAQKGFEFEQVTFKMGKPAEDNHNFFMIGDNNLEYLEVEECTIVKAPAVKKARIVAMDGCVVAPLKKKYLLSSEEITSGRIPAYNIGRGRFVQKNNVFRENHIFFDDDPVSPLREEYRCVSRNHAHIGFENTTGFFFQVDEGGAFPGKTLLINGGKTIRCESVNAKFPLQNGDKIIVKDSLAIKTILVYKDINE